MQLKHRQTTYLEIGLDSVLKVQYIHMNHNRARRPGGGGKLGGGVGGEEKLPPVKWVKVCTQCSVETVNLLGELFDNRESLAPLSLCQPATYIM